MNERKLTKAELKKREDIIMNMKGNKRDLVKKYGKDAEAVMYGRATNMAKKQSEGMKDPKLTELIKDALKNPKKADLNKDGKISDYEEKRGAAIEKNIKELDSSIPLMKDFTYDYEDIGQFYLERFNRPHSLTPDQLENLGRKIVKQLYKGDIGAAYDDLVNKKPLDENNPEEKIDEDLDLGHEDNEPHMLKADLYRIGKYAMELYQMVDGFEGKGEVDFPHWWQSKISNAKSAIVGAKHYLDFEIKEPQIDAMVDVAQDVEAIDEFELEEATRYSGFDRNPENPDSIPFEPTGSVSEFKEDLRALFGKFKGDLKNPEFIKGVAQIMVNWKALVRSQLEAMLDKDVAGTGADQELDSVNEVKVGDTLTKDGKKGKVTKVSDTQATVDFGNGDVYGIAHSRIKGSEIVKEGKKRFYQQDRVNEGLSESNWFEDVVNRKGNIVHTKSGTYKILTTKPNIKKPDFYLDTDMNRIQQIDPKDEGNYDLDISSYKKAVKESVNEGASKEDQFKIGDRVSVLGKKSKKPFDSGEVTGIQKDGTILINGLETISHEVAIDADLVVIDLSKAEKIAKRLAKQIKESKKQLDEYTENNFSGNDLIAQTPQPGRDELATYDYFFPDGVASRSNAISSLQAHDESPIKARMGRYAPIFAHVQYHEFEDESAEKYRVHQTQYYNSNFKDQDPNFNPGVTRLSLFKLTPSGDTDKKVDMGSILVKTDDYIRDLKNLNITKRQS